MEEIVRQIKNQQEINFINVRDQIEMADLETVFDGENHSRYIFHYLHSLDRFFINPCDYVYEGEKFFGIPEGLCAIDPSREGCEYSRLELILAQFRHLMWHVGLSSGITFSTKHEWNNFTGLTKLNLKLFGKEH